MMLLVERQAASSSCVTDDGFEPVGVNDVCVIHELQ